MADLEERIRKLELEVAALGPLAQGLRELRLWVGAVSNADHRLVRLERRVMELERDRRRGKGKLKPVDYETW